jgi:hypothetical protein
MTMLRFIGSLIAALGIGVSSVSAAPLSDRRACAIEKDTLTVATVVFDQDPFLAIHFTKDGFVLDFKKDKHVVVNYTNIAGVQVDARKNENRVVLQMRDKKEHHFTFAETVTGQQQRGAELQGAITTLSDHATKGAHFVCSDDPADYASELASFQAETAAWRALPVKPALSEEVYKDRLLAEDAFKSKDLPAALTFYEEGIAAGPTWDQGWYNAALVYAEMGDPFDAAVCMKHYVALVPDAQDIRAAKDNIILWETKAASRTSVAAAAPSAPTRRRR